MSEGHIWPEYWIDCCECDHHEALAVSKAPAKEARKRGWKRKGDFYAGAWICPDCVALSATGEAA